MVGEGDAVRVRSLCTAAAPVIITVLFAILVLPLPVVAFRCSWMYRHTAPLHTPWLEAFTCTFEETVVIDGGGGDCGPISLEDSTFMKGVVVQHCRNVLHRWSVFNVRAPFFVVQFTNISSSSTAGEGGVYNGDATSAAIAPLISLVGASTGAPLAPPGLLPRVVLRDIALEDRQAHAHLNETTAGDDDSEASTIRCGIVVRGGDPSRPLQLRNSLTIERVRFVQYQSHATAAAAAAAFTIRACEIRVSNVVVAALNATEWRPVIGVGPVSGNGSVRVALDRVQVSMGSNTTASTLPHLDAPSSAIWSSTGAVVLVSRCFAPRLHLSMREVRVRAHVVCAIAAEDCAAAGLAVVLLEHGGDGSSSSSSSSSSHDDDGDDAMHVHSHLSIEMEQNSVELVVQRQFWAPHSMQQQSPPDLVRLNATAVLISVNGSALLAAGGSQHAAPQVRITSTHLRVVTHCDDLGLPHIDGPPTPRHAAACTSAALKIAIEEPTTQHGASMTLLLSRITAHVADESLPSVFSLIERHAHVLRGIDIDAFVATGAESSIILSDTTVLLESSHRVVPPSAPSEETLSKALSAAAVFLALKSLVRAGGSGAPNLTVALCGSVLRTLGNSFPDVDDAARNQRTALRVTHALVASALGPPATAHEMDLLAARGRGSPLTLVVKQTDVKEGSFLVGWDLYLQAPRTTLTLLHSRLFVAGTTTYSAPVLVRLPGDGSTLNAARLVLEGSAFARSNRVWLCQLCDAHMHQIRGVSFAATWEFATLDAPVFVNRYARIHVAARDRWAGESTAAPPMPPPPPPSFLTVRTAEFVQSALAPLPVTFVRIFDEAASRARAAAFEVRSWEVCGTSDAAERRVVWALTATRTPTAATPSASSTGTMSRSSSRGTGSSTPSPSRATLTESRGSLTLSHSWSTTSTRQAPTPTPTRSARTASPSASLSTTETASATCSGSESLVTVAPEVMVVEPPQRRVEGRHVALHGLQLTLVVRIAFFRCEGFATLTTVVRNVLRLRGDAAFWAQGGAAAANPIVVTPAPTGSSSSVAEVAEVAADAPQRALLARIVHLSNRTSDGVLFECSRRRIAVWFPPVRSGASLLREWATTTRGVPQFDIDLVFSGALLFEHHQYNTTEAPNVSTFVSANGGSSGGRHPAVKLAVPLEEFNATSSLHVLPFTAPSDRLLDFSPLLFAGSTAAAVALLPAVAGGRTATLHSSFRLLSIGLMLDALDPHRHFRPVPAPLPRILSPLGLEYSGLGAATEAADRVWLGACLGWWVLLLGCTAAAALVVVAVQLTTGKSFVAARALVAFPGVVHATAVTASLVPLSACAVASLVSAEPAHVGLTLSAGTLLLLALLLLLHLLLVLRLLPLAAVTVVPRLADEAKLRRDAFRNFVRGDTQWIDGWEQPCEEAERRRPPPSSDGAVRTAFVGMFGAMFAQFRLGAAAFGAFECAVTIFCGCALGLALVPPPFSTAADQLAGVAQHLEWRSTAQLQAAVGMGTSFLFFRALLLWVVRPMRVLCDQIAVMVGSVVEVVAGAMCAVAVMGAPASSLAASVVELESAGERALGHTTRGLYVVAAVAAMETVVALLRADAHHLMRIPKLGQTPSAHSTDRCSAFSNDAPLLPDPPPPPPPPPPPEEEEETQRALQLLAPLLEQLVRRQHRPSHSTAGGGGGGGGPRNTSLDGSFSDFDDGRGAVLIEQELQHGVLGEETATSLFSPHSPLHRRYERPRYGPLATVE